jgi:hypothetical protein
MENIDKGLTVPKWVLINLLKIPQMPQTFSAQAQKFGISIKKRLHWASIVRGLNSTLKDPVVNQPFGDKHWIPGLYSGFFNQSKRRIACPYGPSIQTVSVKKSNTLNYPNILAMCQKIFN